MPVIGSFELTAAIVIVAVLAVLLLLAVMRVLRQHKDD
jgi:hypothetical protein